MRASRAATNEGRRSEEAAREEERRGEQRRTMEGGARRRERGGAQGSRSDGRKQRRGAHPSTDERTDDERRRTRERSSADPSTDERATTNDDEPERGAAQARTRAAPSGGCPHAQTFARVARCPPQFSARNGQFSPAESSPPDPLATANFRLPTKYRRAAQFSPQTTAQNAAHAIPFHIGIFGYSTTQTTAQNATQRAHTFIIIILKQNIGTSPKKIMYKTAPSPLRLHPV